MSGHRITAIIAFALCASGAFAANESAANKPFDCDADWPCNYLDTNDAKYYDHKIDDYKAPDGKRPSTIIRHRGEVVLRFKAADKQYELLCYRNHGDRPDVIRPDEGVKVYVVGEANSYMLPDGWEYYPLSFDYPDYVINYEDPEVVLADDFNGWKGTDPIPGAIWECSQSSAWYTGIWKHKSLNPNSLDQLYTCNDLWADLPDDGMESVLLPDLDSEKAYRVIMKDGASAEPCTTKRCRSDFKATCNNVDGSSDKCNSYNNLPQCRFKNPRCTGANGTMAIGESDLADCMSEEYNRGIGRTYIEEQVKSAMHNSLQTNIELAQQVFVIDPENGSFTCDTNGCNLKSDVFNGQRCEFRCFTFDIHVRLAPQKTETDGRYTIECPKYFKPALNDNTYTCVFDTNAAQGAIDQKHAEVADAATATMNACAAAICGASDGEYRDGECMCGDDVCTTKFGDTSYKHCGGVKRDLGTYFCVNNVLGLGLPKEHRCHENNRPRGTTAQACYLQLVQATYNDTQACAAAASFAASGNNSAADDADDDNISELAKTLDAIENAYGLSKWRTVDGKFNYARLASDATAAVVLGTTGALVTSSVVKKKQVEAGFESLECMVGGQHVGDWGDVFRIDGK